MTDHSADERGGLLGRGTAGPSGRRPRAAAMTAGQIRARLSSSCWSIVHPRVYRSTDDRGQHGVSRPSGRLVGRRSLGAVGVGRRVVVKSDRRRIGHRRIAEHAQLVMLRPSPAARGVRCRPSQRRSRRRGVICVRDRGTRIVRPGLPAADCAWLRAAPRHRVGLVRADGGARPGRARTAGPRPPDTRQPAESPDSLTTEGMRGSARAGQLLRAAADGDAAASERGLFCPVTHRSPGRADQRFWPFDVPQQHGMA